MNVSRVVRLNELLRREIGEAIFRVVRDERFDMSAVTVTRVITSRDLRHARVMVSIREHRDERGHMLDALRGCRARIQSAINRDLALKYTPRLIFELDESIAKGDDVLGILSELDTEPPAAEDGDGQP